MVDSFYPYKQNKRQSIGVCMCGRKIGICCQFSHLIHNDWLTFQSENAVDAVHILPVCNPNLFTDDIRQCVREIFFFSFSFFLCVWCAWIHCMCVYVQYILSPSKLWKVLYNRSPFWAFTAIVRNSDIERIHFIVFFILIPQHNLSKKRDIIHDPLD